MSLNGLDFLLPQLLQFIKLLLIFLRILPLPVLNHLHLFRDFQKYVFAFVHLFFLTMYFDPYLIKLLLVVLAVLIPIRMLIVITIRRGLIL